MPETIGYRPNHAGVRVDLDRLIASRMLIQANSGGGKSRALRQLLEETHGRVQHLVVDPEGEFSTLRERFDYVLAAPKDGDVLATPKTARVLCRRLMELGASAVLDIYDLDHNQRREFVKLFLTELMALPKALWRPCLVVIDEAHVFAPQVGESQALDAVTALCTQGRKRGFSAVLATQRIAKLHKDAAAELLNKLVGRTGLDVDVKRAGDELGFDKDQRNGLKHLAPGTFFAYGPAIANEVRQVRTGDVITSHPEAGKVSAAPPPAPERVRKVLAQLQDLAQKAEEEARTIEDLERQNRELKATVRKLERQPGPQNQEKRGPTPTDPAVVDRAVAAAMAKHDRTVRAVMERRAKDLARLARSIEAATATLVAAAAEMRQELELPAAPQPSAPASSHAAVKSSPPREQSTVREHPQPVVPAEGLSRPQQGILNALAAFEACGIDAPLKHNVAVFSDASPKSSAFANNLGSLRSRGLIDYPRGGAVSLTDEGRALTVRPLLSSLDDLHGAWRSKIPGPQWRIIERLLLVYPDDIERDELAQLADASATSSAYANNLGALRSLGLIDYRPGKRVVATALLFPEGME